MARLSSLTIPSIKKANPTRISRGDLVVKVNYLTLLAGAALTLLSAAAARAEESAVSAPGSGRQRRFRRPRRATASTAQPVAAASGDTATYYETAIRCGISLSAPGPGECTSSGSPTKVGEYQNLNSSPFWNVDGISSNGDQPSTSAPPVDDNETSDGQAALLRPARRSRPGL